MLDRQFVTAVCIKTCCDITASGCLPCHCQRF